MIGVSEFSNPPIEKIVVISRISDLLISVRSERNALQITVFPQPGEPWRRVL